MLWPSMRRRIKLIELSPCSQIGGRGRQLESSPATLDWCASKPDTETNIASQVLILTFDRRSLSSRIASCPNSIVVMALGRLRSSCSSEDLTGAGVLRRAAVIYTRLLLHLTGCMGSARYELEHNGPAYALHGVPGGSAVMLRSAEFLSDCASEPVF